MKFEKLMIALAFIFCILCGCSTVESVNNEHNTSMFKQIEETAFFKVVYHKKTKVMYVVSDSNRNRGNFTLLVNADGTPMLYEGEE